MINRNNFPYNTTLHGHVLYSRTSSLTLVVILLFSFSELSHSNENAPGVLNDAAVQAPGSIKKDQTTSASRTVYVDLSIKKDSCKNYSSSQRICGNGKETAYRDMNRVSAAVMPGDTVLIRQAIYTNSFVPQKSGSAGSPIIYRNYPGEKPVIVLKEKPALPAIILDDKHHITIDGLTVDGAWSWALLWNASHITVENSVFLNARDRGSRGGFRTVNSDYNRILGNRFEDGNDNLMLENSNFNLVQGNRFRKARHTLLVIACGNQNVIRQNVFHNELQKAGETFDCEGKISSHYDDTRQIRRLDATKRNIWERNQFIHTRQSEKWYKYNAIQLAGQHGIIRHNIFHSNLGGGVALQVYKDEALYNYSNRIYHNTFHNNRCFGVFAGRGPARKYDNNVVKNNVFTGNRDCLGEASADILNHDHRATETEGNYFGDPLFIDTIHQDYRLQPLSPAIDTGEFLTRTVGAGTNSNILKVLDTGYFFDGYGIPGEAGDTIRLEGKDVTAVVLAVDDKLKTLRLDRPVSWADGQGVALNYAGKKPDPGANERE